MFDERLNLIPWGDFYTAYGPALKVPDQLRRLGGPDRKAALAASHDLWCGLCHQHVRVGSAALPALPFLLEVLDAADRDMTVELLDILLGIAVGVNQRRFLEFQRSRDCTESVPEEQWITDLRAALVSGAVTASVIEIESILGTGPAFSLLGLALAVRGRRSQSTVFFGLSAGVVSIAVFFLIYLRHWSPEDARYPVPLMLITYDYLIAPVALLAVYRLRRGSGAREPGRARMQFGLQHLLLLTTYFAIVFALLRLAMSGHPLPVAVAPGLVVMLTVIISWRRYPPPASSLAIRGSPAE